ncbi:DinB family protein [Flavobacterium chuncheonense]|uniref:DinB family protein n=1 Tax=Flavobacterium chuncheonense TaxID=2026653 RepID=A0ABW5YMK5_9FLAO
MRFLILLISLFSLTAVSQNEPINAFLEKWENSKNYLLQIAEAMPEEAYSFKPTEREMTFAQQLTHIKDNMEWLSRTYFTNENYTKSKDNQNYTKAEILAILQNSFDSVSVIIKKTPVKELKQKVDFFAGEKTKLQILNLLQDHVTHHRGQIIVYLNLNNIQPPKYVGW